MYSIRTLTGDLSNLLSPSFRKVNFSDARHVTTVATLARQAWTTTPSPSDLPEYTDFGVLTRVAEMQAHSDAEILSLKKEDMTVHTPWRDTVYVIWNHVFVDVMRFLPEVGMGVGHFHPPNHDVLELSFGHRELVQKWETNVLIVPGFLGTGVKVSMYEGDTKLGSFDEENEFEVWWLKEGSEVKFVVEREGEGLAAVLMLGILCSADDQEVEEEEDDEDDSDEEGDDAVKSPGKTEYVFENSDDESSEEEK